MTTRRGYLLACSLTAVAFAAGAGIAHAQPLRIDGIGALEPLSAVDVTPQVVAHRLEIRLQDDRLLSVAPWPAFLPQRFTAQKLEASRKVFPTGPADRVAFIRSPARQPWLVVGNGARDGAALVGAWKLQRSDDDWAVSDGRHHETWRVAMPLSVAAGHDRWCLYLLDAGTLRRQPGIASEGEPRVAWAAQRLDARGRCAALTAPSP
jgi:hypothetical protein